MLLDQIKSDLTSAQKNRDQARIDTLRFLLGAIHNLEIDKKNLREADVISVTRKQVKTHQESIEMFEKAGRQDLVSKEKAELAILQSYLPPAMGETEVRVVVERIKSANPSADFGQLMKLAMRELQGKAGGFLVSKLLKELK